MTIMSKRGSHSKDESNKKTKRYYDDTCGSASLGKHISFGKASF